MKRRLLDSVTGCTALGAFLFMLVENTAFGDTHALVFRAANLIALLVFVTDALSRFLASGDKRRYLASHGFDLVVFVPFAQYGATGLPSSFFVAARLLAIVVMLITRGWRNGDVLALLGVRPGQFMVIGFLGAIGIGGVLLMLPAASVAGLRTPMVDAIFTATSAVCVTGLAVRDTATYFSRFGQLVILALIQAGGLGIMTFSVSLVVFSGRRMDIKSRAAMQDVLDYDTLSGVRGLVRFIFVMTFGFEALGALLLFLTWNGRVGGMADAAYHAVFHAVSAFCNAGFSTFSDNLAGFDGDAVTLAIVGFLIVVGGLGFMVVRDALNEVRERLGMRKYAGHRTRIQTKIVLTVTLLLLVAGALAVYVMELHGALATYTPGRRVLNAVFQSITARTAGFNTLDTGRLMPATLLVILVLMFIGASPGSAAGGIKTTTLATLWAAVRASFRNRTQAELCHRTIPADIVQKAVTLLCFSLMLVGLFSVALLHLEKKPFLDVVFETVSAFGTVGLSMGVTPALTDPGKVLLTVLMFVGRLGPVSLAYALLRGAASVGRYEYADERVMIG